VRSLRGRLTLGVTVVLGVVLLVAGVLTSRYVERTDREALDDRLQRTAELSAATAVAAIEEELPDSDRRLDAVLDATGSSLRLMLGDAVLLETGDPPAGRPPPGQGLHTFTAGGRRYRSLTTTLRAEELGGLAALEVTTGLTALEERQAELNTQLLILGLLTLLVAATGTWLAARLVLRPLERLRRLASSIAGAADLDRRVPDHDGPAELRSLAVSFNAMLARLGRSSADRERALAATRRFAADAGHELRTPLTSVLATLSSLRRHPELDDQRRAAMLDDALTEHRRLVVLVDGLQAMARGDASTAPDGEMDLAELAGAAVEAAAARHPGCEVTAALPPGPVRVRGWEPGLRLVLDNLLENAARHGGGRPPVRLTLEPPADGDGPVLHVDDGGPGVPAGDRERVFEPFVRLQAAQHPGSGLGLALVAQQVRHHGGTVTAGDSPLGGARFTVRLPPAG